MAELICPVDPGVLNPDDDPAFDPGFGGGSYIDPVLTGAPTANGITFRVLE